VSGPSWAWLVLAGRRDLRPELARRALTVNPVAAGPVILGTARAFA
jgi:hypothetical protein